MSQLPISSNGPLAPNGSHSPLIFLHCPSNRGLKGTEHIIQAAEELQAEGYELSLIILEKMPHECVLEAMSRADVIVDQLLIGWYGMVSIEAWALRKPVICYIRPDLPKAPACPADPSTIKDAMREMLKYPETREMWAQKGYKYVRRVHDARGMEI